MVDRGLVTVEEIPLDLTGLSVGPGLINAHDHLSFALFPTLGNRHYSNASEWARDIYHPDREPIRQQLRVPKRLCMLWGGLRNLLSGVTTVCHHDPYESLFDEGFPIRVIHSYGWAHSLAFDDGGLVDRFASTPPDAPFLIHAAEGTDSRAADEIFRLDELGVLSDRTVLIHAVGASAEGWKLIHKRGCSVVWCPRSNLFTLGRTLSPASIPGGVNVALGTDSPITADGDLLDEMCAARRLLEGDHDWIRRLVTSAAQRMLRLPDRPDDWIAALEGGPPELVVIDGEIQLISPRLAHQAPPEFLKDFFPLTVSGRPAVLVRFDIDSLIDETRRSLGEDSAIIRLAGREVLPAAVGCAG
jgi:cytosine/adenosine deaminase-related metal-dependent hydrolase